jgi:hypothetical protein
VTVSADARALDASVKGGAEFRASEAYREAFEALRNGDDDPHGHGPATCYLRALVLLALYDFRERHGIRALVADLHADEPPSGGERREVPRADDPLAAAFADLPPAGGTVEHRPLVGDGPGSAPPGSPNLNRG